MKKLDVWEKFIVAHSFRNVEDDFSWAFVGVYKPNSDCDRTYLWEELVGLISWWNMPRCIGGDFNVTWFPSERSGETRLCPDMVEFSDFIFEQGLMDISLVFGGVLRLVCVPLWLKRSARRAGNSTMERRQKLHQPFP